METKFIILSKCAVCPFRERRIPFSVHKERRACNIQQRVIYDHDERTPFPEWCPLATEAQVEGFLELQKQKA